MQLKSIFGFKIIILVTILCLYSITSYSASAPKNQPVNKNIINVAFSQDNSILAVSTPAGICLYDSMSLIEIKFIETETSLTPSNFSPDGTTFATGGNDNNITLWDVKNRIETATLSGHKAKVTCVSFSPNGALIASGGKDNIIKLWDAKTHLGVATLVGHAAKITSISFSPDGKLMTSLSSDNVMKLWNVKTYQELATLKGRLDWTFSPNFSPDTTFVAKRKVFTESLKVSDLKISQSSIKVGDTTSIEATADYSGDSTALTHLWAASSGSIQGSGNKATYIAPDTPGTYSINVKATDGAVSSERTAEVNVQQGANKSSLQLDSNKYWPAKDSNDQLSYDVKVTKLSGGKIVLHYDITQDNDKFDAFFSVGIGQKIILQDTAIGNEQPSTGVRTIGDIDVSNIITAPGQYKISLYINPGDRISKGWLLNEARLVGVEGSSTGP